MTQVIDLWPPHTSECVWALHTDVHTCEHVQTYTKRFEYLTGSYLLQQHFSYPADVFKIKFAYQCGTWSWMKVAVFTLSPLPHLLPEVSLRLWHCHSTPLTQISPALINFTYLLVQLSIQELFIKPLLKVRCLNIVPNTLASSQYGAYRRKILDV